uniref:Uncharacterized protein n=1 Tax=Anguilla anguilla TaxID=7936 RepID=A0A0E9QKT0_ANGAN
MSQKYFCHAPISYYLCTSLTSTSTLSCLFRTLFLNAFTIDDCINCPPYNHVLNI